MKESGSKNYKTNDDGDAIDVQQTCGAVFGGYLTDRTTAACAAVSVGCGCEWCCHELPLAASSCRVAESVRGCRWRNDLVRAISTHSVRSARGDTHRSESPRRTRPTKDGWFGRWFGRRGKSWHVGGCRTGKYRRRRSRGSCRRMSGVVSWHSCWQSTGRNRRCCRWRRRW